MDTVLLVSLCLLTIISLMCGSIHFTHLISLYNYRNVQYIQRRKPKLLIIYVVFSILMLFLIIPNICASIYLQRHNDRHAEYYFILDVIYGSIFCLFIHIIAIRGWLLFYEHRFAIATLNRNWRHIITPTDTNFFLEQRHTFGNDTFLLKIVFATYSAIIMFLLSMIYFLANVTDLYHEYLFFTLRIFVCIPVSIFVFFIGTKIRNNDSFEIRREMQYLSYLLCYLLMMSGAELCVLYVSPSFYIFDCFVYFGDIIFIFWSSYLQTGWVLKRAKINMKKLEKQRRTYKANTNGNEASKSLSMVQLLRNKTSFEAFMRHCVNEFSLESVLFLVEVAQFKATLCSYDAPDRMSQFHSIDIEKEDLRQLLIDSREQRHTPLPDHDADLEFNTSTPLTKRRNEFQLFQGTILSRRWMPIAAHLRPLHAETVLSESFIPAMDASTSMRDLSVIRSSSPIELTIEVANITRMPSIEERTTATATLTTSGIIPISPHSSCSVTSEWIRHFATFLYDKYIKTDSDLSVNICHHTRHALNVLFSKDNEELFEHIIKHSGGKSDRSEAHPAGISEQLLINTFLYHIFDKSFEEIWKLTRENSFLRFTFTETYEQLTL